MSLHYHICQKLFRQGDIGHIGHKVGMLCKPPSLILLLHMSLRIMNVRLQAHCDPQQQGAKIFTMRSTLHLGGC